jgi:NOL1/NOP2/fmu family ribosome biogenesis protein
VPPQRHEILAYFTQRFGIALAAFHGLQLLERQRLFVLLRASSHLAALASLKVQGVGLPVLRKMPRHLKPTTAALQRFGHYAVRNTVSLTGSQTDALLQGEALSLQLDVQPGYVVLISAGHILGCGLYTPGRLRSQIPRRLRAHLRFEAEFHERQTQA